MAKLKNKPKVKWYTIVIYEDGMKNSEWDLTKTAAVAIYEYFLKNMSVLKVSKVSFGSYE